MNLLFGPSYTLQHPSIGTTRLKHMEPIQFKVAAQEFWTC